MKLKKFKSAMLTLGLIASMAASASADPLDDCRNILLSGNYSIKYENITPPTREAMKEKLYMYDGKMIDFSNPHTLYQPISGIVVAAGNRRYIETNAARNVQNLSVTKEQVQALSQVGIGGLLSKFNKPREYEYATCNFTKDDEQFLYTRIKDKDKIEYVGKKKGKLEAIKIKKGFKFGYAYDLTQNI